MAGTSHGGSAAAVILDVDGTLCDVRPITHHGYGSDRPAGGWMVGI